MLCVFKNTPNSICECTLHVSLSMTSEFTNNHTNISFSNHQDVFTTAKAIPTTMLRMYKSTMAPFTHPTTTAPTTTTTFLPPTLSTLRTTAARSWHAFTTERTFFPTTATTPKTFAPSTYATFRDFFDLRSFNNIVSNDVANGMFELTKCFIYVPNLLIRSIFVWYSLYHVHLFIQIFYV